ncbi:sensor histidine kinase [Streptococcus moroccensis]|uniref:histidine kinase n=1 Tax=Streptococcus moroccensis TaxID=1451356 RepID=A0ABT9YR89_9STRE|nr:HAMP domain-containing sensor histidine kinase [Streptococcus moroccensis]MDQ0222523.1 signal transduction histidine kinase [Streptococcus moroccensis]
MIQRLRRQFILIAAIAIIVILSSVIGVLNSVQYYQSQKQIDSILTILVENKGKFPSVSEAKDQFGETTNEDFLHQYRYFSLTLDENNEVQDSYLDQISAFTVSEIEDQVVDRVVSSGRKSGIFRNKQQAYAYRLADLEDDETLLVVLDVTTFYTSQTRMHRLSMVMFGSNFLIFILIVTVLSARVVEPFVANYERQKRFITNAGHELKTPLAIISANTELQEMLDGETEWSKSTKEQTERLTSLINQMVLLAKMEEMPDIELIDINFSKVVADVSQNFKSLTTKNQLDYHVSIQPDVIVQAEEKALFELVTILLDNACKYCDPGGQVIVSLSQSTRLRKKARLVISNTYVAGKDVDYSRFFDRFYRQDQSHSSDVKGFGIGLSMAERSVQLFKGRLDVSHKDELIHFTVTL